MYTFPDTGGEVISSCLPGGNLYEHCHGQSPLSVDPGAEARVFEWFMPILACKCRIFYHPHFSLCNHVYSVMIVLFRYRIRENGGFTLIYIIRRHSVHRPLEVGRKIVCILNIGRLIAVSPQFALL